MPSLLDAAVTRGLAAGSVLVRHGVADGGWWLVLWGTLCAETTTRSGRRSIVEFLGPGDVIAGPPAWDRVGPSAAVAFTEVRSLTECRVMWWAPGAMEDGVRRDPGVGAWLHERLLARLHRAHRALARSLGHSVTERVEQVLCELASIQGCPAPGGVRIPFAISQEILAAAVGATRESANRAVGTLQAQGRIRRSGLIYTLLTEPGRIDPGRAPRGSPSPPGPA